MKQLYIRKGNIEENKNILIIGEESTLGGRDSAYRPKGTLHYKFLKKKDPITGTEGLLYVHACNNILLDSDIYYNDHAIHKYVKQYCKDLVKWDGESNEGRVQSREAFIVKNKKVDKTVYLLRKRISGLIKPENIWQWIKRLYLSSKLLKKHKPRRRAKKCKLKTKLYIFFFISIAILYFLYTKTNIL